MTKNMNQTIKTTSLVCLCLLYLSGCGVGGGEAAAPSGGSASFAPSLTSESSNSFASGPASKTLSGSCTTDHKMYLIDVSSGFSQTQMCVGGVFSFTVQRLSDGTFNYQLKEENLFTHEVGTVDVTWTVDASAPSAPSLTVVDGSGSFSNPYSSTTTTLSLIGGCETGTTVSYVETMPADTNYSQTGSVTCSGSTYTFNFSGHTTNTQYVFAIKQTDSAGNISATTNFTWSKNPGTGPSTPVITSPASLSVTTNTGSTTINGTCTNGNTVKVSGPATATIGVCSGSAFTYSATKSVNGNYAYSFYQTDVSLVDSASATVNWHLDMTPPSSIVLTTPSSSPYSSSNATLIIQGTCETGATVYVTGGLTLSQVCSAGAFSFSHSPSSPTNGQTFNYTLYQTDSASNSSGNTTLQWVYDNTIPNSPTISGSNPKLTKNGDATTATLAGTCTTGEIVTLVGDIDPATEITNASPYTYYDADLAQNVTEIESQVCASNSYSFGLTKGSTTATYSINVSATNSTSGNTSSPTLFTWYIDQAVPSAPTITSPGVSPYTSPSNITMSGACETGTTVSLLTSGGTLKNSMTCSGGVYSFLQTESSDATYNYVVKQTDYVGNISSTSAQQWIKNSTSIPAPTISVNNPLYFNTSSVVVSGLCDYGYIVVLAGAGVVAGDVTTPAGSLEITCPANGTYSYTISKSTDSTYALTLQQRNNTGSLYSSPVSLSLVRDTVNPSITLSRDATTGNPNYSGTAGFTYSITESNLSSLECKLESGGVYSTCAASPMSYSFNNTTDNGSHTVYLKATDLAGNSAESSVTWVQSYHYTMALFHLEGTTTETDSGTYGINLGTVTGSAPSSNASGKFSKARMFNGSNCLSTAALSSTSYTNAALSTITKKLTIEAWVNMPSSSNSRYSIASRYGSTSIKYGYDLAIRNNGTASYIYFSMASSATGTSVTRYTSSAFTGATTGWHHVAVTFDNGSIKYYFDGVQRGSSTGFATLAVPTAPVTVGCRASSGFISQAIRSGWSIDEVRISNYIRYTGAFTPSASAFTAD